MRKEFIPPAVAKPTISEDVVEVPPPLENPGTQKLPIIMLLMPVMMLMMMVVMIVPQIANGGKPNPMMLMMPMMMLMMIPAMLANRGGGKDIGEERKNYMLQMREARGRVAENAKQLRAAQLRSFPDPQMLPMCVGATDSRYPSMWQVLDEETSSINAVDADTDRAETSSPFLTPRVGVTPAKAYPALDIGEVEIQERVEPASYITFRNFIEIQSIVADMPTGFPLRKFPISVVVGEREDVIGMLYSWVLSLAFNHDPELLKIHIASNRLEDWEWVKWLPHCRDESDRVFVYESWDDAMDVVDRLTAGRSRFSPVSNFGDDGESVVHIVFVDDTSRRTSIPPMWPDYGRKGVMCVIGPFDPAHSDFQVLDDAVVVLSKKQIKS